MEEPMKDCCSKAINNYRRNNALKLLREIAKFDTSLNKNTRDLLIAFMKGMEI